MHALQLDEYQVPVSISLHLAGLQAQADYGNYDVNKMFRYYTAPLHRSPRPPLPAGVRSIATSVIVCLSARISRKPRRRTSPNLLCVLPLVVARFSSDGVAIGYALPVLWMTSCFHAMARRRVMCIPKRR